MANLFRRNKVDSSILAGSDAAQQASQLVDQAVEKMGEWHNGFKQELKNSISNADIVNQNLGISNVDAEINNAVSNYSVAKSVNTQKDRVLSAIDTSVQSVIQSNKQVNDLEQKLATNATRDVVESTSKLVKGAAIEDQVMGADAAYEFGKDEARSGIGRSFVSGVASAGAKAVTNQFAQNEEETGNRMRTANYVPADNNNPAYYESRGMFGDKSYGELNNNFTTSALASGIEVVYTGESTEGETNP